MTTDTTMTLEPATSPVLRARAVEVEDIPGQVLPMLGPMRRLMRDRRGVGLAAPQVGIRFRFFIMDIKAVPVAINPEWRPCDGSGRVSRLEGCLTWPLRETFVGRYERIVARWTNADGEARVQVLEGQEARVFQHETDHLNGVCIFGP